MDILAARKKAVEQARQRQEQAVPVEPAPQPAQPPQTADDVCAAGSPAPEDSVPPALPVEAAHPGPAESAADVAEASVREQPAEASEEPTVQQEIELLSFRAGGEAYAVIVDDVREVLKIRDVTAVPNTPVYLLGVMSLRGAMLPIFDLCRRLGLTPVQRDEKSRIIVVSPDEEDAGLLVDRVTGVLRILPDAIRPVPENIAQGAEYLRGIVRKDDKLYILLDLEKTTSV
jgi:purine-binding chemotaxis protein CheW